MQEVKIKVSGMTCQHCVKAMQMELDKLYLKSHNVEIGSVEVEYDETKVRLGEIENAIREAGYQIVK